jgi:putative endonuclease
MWADSQSGGVMASSHRFGRGAEERVAAHLEARGWRILDRNWRFHRKELDIVAERDGLVAFVEVKARSPAGWGHPLEAITAGKRRDLAVAARGWIAMRGRPGQAYRFDAAVVLSGAGAPRVDYYPDAWRL